MPRDICVLNHSSGWVNDAFEKAKIQGECLGEMALSGQETVKESMRELSQKVRGILEKSS